MPSLLHTVDLIKRYSSAAGDVEVLHGINLRIEAGEFVAIMGPSGSGKSTFMNILGGLDRPSAGRYLVDGEAIDQLNADQLAALRNRRFGFVFQGFNLLPRASIGDNVSLPMLYAGASMAARKQRADELLAQVGLGGLAARMPAQLSGGQQQRVAIARALANRPQVLFADEPTGNLDTHTSEEVMQIFTTLNRESGVTIVLVTHEPDIARFANRLIRFTDGHVVADGTPESVLGGMTTHVLVNSSADAHEPH